MGNLGVRGECRPGRETEIPRSAVTPGGPLPRCRAGIFTGASIGRFGEFCIYYTRCGIGRARVEHPSAGTDSLLRRT